MLSPGPGVRLSSQVLDSERQPTTVSKTTRIVLEKSPVRLLRSREKRSHHPAKRLQRYIQGVSYAQYANDVVLRCPSAVRSRASGGHSFGGLCAYGGRRNATGGEFDLQDPECGVGGVPTPNEPTCGHLLTTGANGARHHVRRLMRGPRPLSDRGDTPALVVTLVADLTHSEDDPYSTMILACDKTRCGGSGVPKIPVFYTFDNDADLESQPECPSKGILGTLEICVDYVQSTRSGRPLSVCALRLRFHG